MNRVFVAALAPLILAGCASVGSIQTACEQQSQGFGQMVTCLDGRIAQDGRLSRHPGVKLYVLKAGQLSQQVAQGRISELDAKVELQALFVQLDGQNQAQVARMVANTQAAQPLRATCTTVGTKSTCTER